MKLTPLNIPGLMRKYDLHADKRLGQNFLIDENALLKIVQAAELSTEHWVLEIGAGLGNLTRHLAAITRYVVAVEVDARLLPALQDTVSSYQNVHIVLGDFLDMNLSEYFPKKIGEEISSPGFCVVANIPYYITSAVIRHLLEGNIKPQRIILTVQSEVAERICEIPGNMSLLALSVQVYGSPHIISSIHAGAFFPKPKVDSKILRIDLHPQPLIAEQFLDIFFHLIKAGFSQKRKTIRNAFKSGLGWPLTLVDNLLFKSGMDPKRRAETLSLPEWNLLCKSYNQLANEIPKE